VSKLIKIHNGTVSESAHLCDSCCASSHRLENGRAKYFCRERSGFNDEVYGRVTQCSSYLSNQDRHASREFRGLAYELDFDEDREPMWTTPAGKRVRRRSRRNPSVKANPSREVVQ
jgi:hypothetical protein